MSRVAPSFPEQHAAAARTMTMPERRAAADLVEPLRALDMPAPTMLFKGTGVIPLDYLVRDRARHGVLRWALDLTRRWWLVALVTLVIATRMLRILCPPHELVQNPAVEWVSVMTNVFSFICYSVVRFWTRRFGYWDASLHAPYELGKVMFGKNTENLREYAAHYRLMITTRTQKLTKWCFGLMLIPTVFWWFWRLGPIIEYSRGDESAKADIFDRECDEWLYDRIGPELYAMYVMVWYFFAYSSTGSSLVLVLSVYIVFRRLLLATFSELQAVLCHFLGSPEVVNMGSSVDSLAALSERRNFSGRLSHLQTQRKLFDSPFTTPFQSPLPASPVVTPRSSTTSASINSPATPWGDVRTPNANEYSPRGSRNNSANSSPGGGSPRSSLSIPGSLSVVELPSSASSSSSRAGLVVSRSNVVLRSVSHGSALEDSSQGPRVVAAGSVASTLDMYGKKYAPDPLAVFVPDEDDDDDDDDDGDGDGDDDCDGEVSPASPRPEAAATSAGDTNTAGAGKNIASAWHSWFTPSRIQTMANLAHLELAWRRSIVFWMSLSIAFLSVPPTISLFVLREDVQPRAFVTIIMSTMGASLFLASIFKAVRDKRVLQKQLHAFYHKTTTSIHTIPESVRKFLPRQGSVSALPSSGLASSAAKRQNRDGRDDYDDDDGGDLRPPINEIDLAHADQDDADAARITEALRDAMESDDEDSDHAGGKQLQEKIDEARLRKYWKVLYLELREYFQHRHAGHVPLGTILRRLYAPIFYTFLVATLLMVVLSVVFTALLQPSCTSLDNDGFTQLGDSGVWLSANGQAGLTWDDCPAGLTEVSHMLHVVRALIVCAFPYVVLGKAVVLDDPELRPRLNRAMLGALACTLAALLVAFYAGGRSPEVLEVLMYVSFVCSGMLLFVLATLASSDPARWDRLLENRSLLVSVYVVLSMGVLAAFVAFVELVEVPTYVSAPSDSTRLLVAVVVHPVASHAASLMISNLAQTMVRMTWTSDRGSFVVWALARGVMTLYSRYFLVNIQQLGLQVTAVLLFSFTEVTIHASGHVLRYFFWLLITGGDSRLARKKAHRYRVDPYFGHLFFFSMMIELTSIAFSGIHVVLGRKLYATSGVGTSVGTVFASTVVQLFAEVIVDLISMKVDLEYNDRSLAWADDLDLVPGTYQPVAAVLTVFLSAICSTGLVRVVRLQA